MMPHLAAFVKHGRKPHDRYMAEQDKRTTCDVPVASGVRGVMFDDAPGCVEKFECSVPMY
jgi:hypothetical protein